MNSPALLGHYALTLYRVLTRQRLYAALNILGLAVGVAVFLVLWLDVRFETGFERCIPHADQIYLVQSRIAGMGRTPATMGATLEELRSDYPQLVGTRYWGQSATIRQGGQITSEQLEVVDPDFFKVFDLPLIAGDKATIFRAPDDLILTRAKATHYFGSANPLGQHLTITFNGVTRAYRVAGVLKDLPRNTDFQFDFVVPLTPQMVAADPAWRHWGNVEVGAFLRLDTPVAAKALDAELDNFVDRHAAHDITPSPAHRLLSLRTTPLLSLHLADPKDSATVGALGGVGVLTLLLAALNYINLATARGGLRAREVAVRKVLGATGPTLVAQFMSESVAAAAVASLVGLALCELCLPLANAAGGLALKVDYLGADSIVLPLLATTILIGLAAGAYPALVLSRFQPAQVLASARAPTGGRGGARLREVLVGVQFVIAIAFTVATGVIIAQTDFVRGADLGFDRDGLIVVNAFDDGDVTDAQRASLLEAWRPLPGMASLTASTTAPGNDDSVIATTIRRPGAAGKGPVLHIIRVQPGFFATYGARLKVGRFLDRDHGGDVPPPTPSAQGSGAATRTAGPAQNVVLNVRALGALGFRDATDALGKPLYLDENDGSQAPLTIAGVIGDIRFGSPHTPIPPTIYVMQGQSFQHDIAGVRYANADPRAVLARMAAVWRGIVPNVSFDARTIGDNLHHYYRADEQHGRLFTLGAALAVVIACVGLYGLASFSTARRVREIGIRKTLGASTAQILRLLIGQFLRPVLLANLVAWPLAWLAMRSWLSGFDQRIGLSPLYFLAAAALTLVIAVATVAGQAFAVARAEPAKALRHE
jgi:putative ABC transport system permease protein